MSFCQFLHNSEWHWECRTEGGGFFQHTINEILHIWHNTNTPAFCPEVTVPYSRRRGWPWQSVAECFYSHLLPKSTLLCGELFVQNLCYLTLPVLTTVNHDMFNQCAYRYFSNMFKYFLHEEPDLFKEVKISKIEWHTSNIHGGEESEWKWCPLRFFLVWLFVGLAFLSIHILISAQLSFLQSRESWKRRFFDRQVIIFLLPHFKAHSTCFASPFLCPSYWTRII